MTGKGGGPVALIDGWEILDERRTAQALADHRATRCRCGSCLLCCLAAAMGDRNRHLGG